MGCTRPEKRRQRQQTKQKRRRKKERENCTWTRQLCREGSTKSSLFLFSFFYTLARQNARGNALGSRPCRLFAGNGSTSSASRGKLKVGFKVVRRCVHQRGKSARNRAVANAARHAASVSRSAETTRKSVQLT